MQPPFPYDNHNLPLLRTSVSAARLQRYLLMSDRDVAQALRLYMWNTALSESLYGPLQGLEITLRNKLNERLAGIFGAPWYDHVRLDLRYAQQQQIDDARDTLRFRGKPLEPGRIMSRSCNGRCVRSTPSS